MSKQSITSFANRWRGKGDEKSDTAAFWNDLLVSLFGLRNTTGRILYEQKVKIGSIDAYIPETRVLIEQKSLGVNLDKQYKQSDGAMLTPYGQAERYNHHSPWAKKARWIVVCDFATFRVYNMDSDDPPSTVQTILLADLPTESARLRFLIDSGVKEVAPEAKISIDAGKLVRKLYDKLRTQYVEPDSAEAAQALNKLCVRLVFCLYAEDADVFGKNQFYNYLHSFDVADMRRALLDLFDVLDTPESERDVYISPKLAPFPYVDGGLFAERGVTVPQFTEEIADALLKDASLGFDWSGINPTIFGAVFESTLNPETRRKGGMHYTSPANIHKVIDPLFMADLRQEFDEAVAFKTVDARLGRLRRLQDKLATLTFFDPACGSGNFLTETFLSLRRLENDILREIYGKEIVLGELENPVKVGIGQFYGIEINDFAVTVARTALWIAELQTANETAEIVHRPLPRLPLKSYANLVEGNALALDWKTVCPNPTYIMGNPPFVGARLMSAGQKKETLAVFGKDWRNVGELDYVCGWYKKAADFMSMQGQASRLRVAFVSTNSITQGEQTAILWKPLMENGVHIDFAHRTFKWGNESNEKQAAVHCVIVGFSTAENPRQRLLFEGDECAKVAHINAYLAAVDDVFVERRSRPLCDVPPMVVGSIPRDDGNLILSPEERDALIAKEPLAAKWIRPFMGAEEFLNGKVRYCLWLAGADIDEMRSCADVSERVERVRKFRQASKRAATRQCADTPTVFSDNRQPSSNFLIVPQVSSERRHYVPIGFMSPNIIVSNLVFVVSNATLFHFGVLASLVHNAWLRAVCGRLEMRYRYSSSVYNNFPWPTPTDEQRTAIEGTARAILDARAAAPGKTLAGLYDDTFMPAGLRRAHRANDAAVLAAYGWPTDLSEPEIVARLMEMYRALIQKGN